MTAHLLNVAPLRDLSGAGFVCRKALRHRTRQDAHRLLLRRSEEADLVRSEGEPVEVARAENRPPRRHYRLTPSAAPMLELARERFPTPAAVPGHGVPADPTR